MLTDTRQALLNAIRDQPDDDAPRLIYADWLDENGDPERAQFIRVQCEEARLPYGHPQRTELQFQTHELFRTHGARWLAPIGIRNNHYFQRGFLYEIPVSAVAFSRDAERLWTYEPVAHINLQGSDVEILAAIQHPLAQELRGLRFDTHSTARNHILHTLACTLLPRLQRLVVQETVFGPSDADLRDVLAAWPLPELREVQLHFCNPTAWNPENYAQEMSYMRGLLVSRYWRTVHTATLINLHSEELMAAWLAVPKPQLRQLTLLACHENRLLPLLTAVPHWPALEALVVSGRDWVPSVGERFCTSALFRQLRRLIVQSNNWPHGWLEQLFRQPHVLEELYLAGNKEFTDELAAALSQHSPGHLRYVNLARTSVTPAAKERLQAAWPSCTIV